MGKLRVFLSSSAFTYTRRGKSRRSPAPAARRTMASTHREQLGRLLCRPSHSHTSSVCFILCLNVRLRATYILLTVMAGSTVPSSITCPLPLLPPPSAHPLLSGPGSISRSLCCPLVAVLAPGPFCNWFSDLALVPFSKCSNPLRPGQPQKSRERIRSELGREGTHDRLWRKRRVGRQNTVTPLGVARM